MRPHTVIILALALAFGGIAAAGVLQLSKKGPAQGGKKVTMVLAAADVPRGEMLTAGLLKTREFPEGTSLPGAIVKVEDAVDRTTLTPLFKGEPLIEGKLAAKGAGRGLASMIKRGMRAITIPTPNVGTGVAGFIVPGSRVDVHWLSSEQSQSSSTGAAPLLENVEVLAVDDKIDVPSANRTDALQMKSVTVQVQPDEASILTPALSKGTIHLSLRNPGDDGRAPPLPAAVAAPAPSPAPEKQVVAARPKIRSIRTFRGLRETIHRLDGQAELPKSAEVPDGPRESVGLAR